MIKSLDTDSGGGEGAGRGFGFGRRLGGGHADEMYPPRLDFNQRGVRGLGRPAAKGSPDVLKGLRSALGLQETPAKKRGY